MSASGLTIGLFDATPLNRVPVHGTKKGTIESIQQSRTDTTAKKPGRLEIDWFLKRKKCRMLSWQRHCTSWKVMAKTYSELSVDIPNVDQPAAESWCLSSQLCCWSASSADGNCSPWELWDCSRRLAWCHATPLAEYVNIKWTIFVAERVNSCAHCIPRRDHTRLLSAVHWKSQKNWSSCEVVFTDLPQSPQRKSRKLEASHCW